MRNIPFVPKRPGGDQPWLAFGSTEADYGRWAGEVCSIACARSLLLALSGSAPSLWQLTLGAVEAGVFVVNGTQVAGAFHRPLVSWLSELGLPARVLARASEADIWSMLDRDVIMLSIDLKQVGPLDGSHLVLVYERDLETNEYLVHDNAGLLGSDGAGCRIDRATLGRLSNGRGVAVRLDEALERSEH